MFTDDAYPVDSDGTAAFEKHIANDIIHAEVNLPQGDKIQGAKFIGRTKEPNVDTVGK